MKGLAPTDLQQGNTQDCPLKRKDIKKETDCTQQEVEARGCPQQEAEAGWTGLPSFIASLQGKGVSHTAGGQTFENTLQTHPV